MSSFYTAVIFMLSCLLLLSGIGCSDNKADNSKVLQKQSLTETVKSKQSIIKIVFEEIPDEVRAVGILKAYQEVEISSEVSGKIKKIHCDVGDKVLQGEMLAETDDESREISLQIKRSLLKKAEASKAKAQKDSKKSSRLFKEGVISDSDSDNTLLEQQFADAELSLARSEVRAAEKELRDTKIKAPFNGKIALKNVELGKLVTPGKNIFTLVDIQKIKIVVHVSEMDISKIETNNTATIVLESLGGEIFHGRVTTIGLKADESTRSFPVEIIVDNPQEKLLPGMVASISILSAKPKKLILIPPNAVHSLNNMKVVYIMKDNKVTKRTVQTSGSINDLLVVENGLSEGDMLIISEIDSENKGSEL
jgi:membrane fusion protein (multidrug efflux system)